MGSSTELVESPLAGCDININFEDCSDENREEGENHIVECDGPREPKRLTWAHWVESEYCLNYCEDHVFVEKVEDHFCYSHIVESAVMEEQFPKQAELSDGVVGYLGGSGALLPEDANPHIGLHYHVDVVGSIAYCQG